MTIPDDKSSRRASLSKNESSSLGKGSQLPPFHTGSMTPNREDMASPTYNARSSLAQNNVSSLNQVVSEPGGTLEALLSSWMEFSPRFPVEQIGFQEADRQLQDKERWIHRISWPKIDSTTESSVDRWFDVVADSVKQHGIGEELFMYLVMLNTPAAIGKAMRKSVHKGLERKVSDIILTLFPVSVHAKLLEEAFFKPERRTCVSDAVTYAQESINAYVRACTRRRRPMCLSVNRVQEFILESLPLHVHRQLALHTNLAVVWLSLDELCQEALIVEQTLVQLVDTKGKREVGFPVSAEGTADIVASPTPSVDRPSYISGDRSKPNNPCSSCGDLHWIKDCPYKTHRCELCRCLGHTEKMCKSKVIKSDDGRIECVLTQHAGSTELHFYKDRTQSHRLQTASTAIKKIIDAINVRSERGKEKRRENKENAARTGSTQPAGRGRSYVATEKQHTVGLTSSAVSKEDEEVHFLADRD